MLRLRISDGGTDYYMQISNRERLTRDIQRKVKLKLIRLLERDLPKDQFTEDLVSSIWDNFIVHKISPIEMNKVQKTIAVYEIELY